MGNRKLITPQFRIQIADRIYTSGLRAECYSSTSEHCNWTELDFDHRYAKILDIRNMEPATVELGYDGDYDTIMTGYVTDGNALGPYKILDDTVFLMRTYVMETFLDCKPQDIIRYGLQKAGITNFRLSDAVFPRKEVVSISYKNVVDLIQEVGQLWGIQAAYYFKGSTFFWGTEIEQKTLYVLEEGKNILSFLKFSNEIEIKTIGMPWIHQGERIRVKHSKFSGDKTVTAIHIKADDDGSVRMFLTFKMEG